jgi:hypothetical protein
VKDPIPFSGENITVRLDDGRIAYVVKSHHASPRERWQMWKMLRATTGESHGAISRKQRRRLNRMFLMTVLKPDCKACWYGIADE